MSNALQAFQQDGYVRFILINSPNADNDLGGYPVGNVVAGLSVGTGGNPDQIVFYNTANLNDRITSFDWDKITDQNAVPYAGATPTARLATIQAMLATTGTGSASAIDVNIASQSAPLQVTSAGTVLTKTGTLSTVGVIITATEATNYSYAVLTVGALTGGGALKVEGYENSSFTGSAPISTIVATKIENDATTTTITTGNARYLIPLSTRFLRVSVTATASAPITATLDLFSKTSTATLATEPTAVATSTAIGARADAAATTDDGTFSLLSLIKRLLVRLSAVWGNETNGAATADEANTGLTSLTKRALVKGYRIRNGANDANINFGQQLAADSLPVVIASNQSPVPVTISGGTGAVKYAAGIQGFSLAATPTDFLRISGSATKTIRVTSILVYGTETPLLGGGAIRDIVVLKRSTANTGGTTTAVVRVPVDSATAAATASIVAYTTNPTTTGTLVGTIASHKLTDPTTGTVSAQYGLQLIDANSPIILRGTAEGLCLNGLGVTRNTDLHSITINWEEF